MLSEITGLLETARDILAAETNIISRIDGTVWHEQLIQMDNQVYALISRAIDLLDEMEDEDEPSNNGNGTEPE